MIRSPEPVKSFLAALSQFWNKHLTPQKMDHLAELLDPFDMID